MASISLSIPMNGSRLGVGLSLNPARQTDPEVLSAIYVAHYAYVLKVCQRFFRQKEDAEDAAAEVFLKLHRVLHTKDETSPFRPWVSQVAGRHCIDKLRSKKLEKHSCVAGIDVSSVIDDGAPSALSQILREEELRQLREHLVRLPEHFRIPLQLHYYKRMTYSEIASKLNRQLPAVKTLIFRAKCLLRRNLNGAQATVGPEDRPRLNVCSEYSAETGAIPPCALPASPPDWNRMPLDR
jgi:RNA polymerase sigma factor (sigma-70 family)